MTGRIKRLERRGRAFLLRGLARVLPGKTVEPPDWDARPYRALYLRYDRIGDMILSSGVFRELVTAHPTISLDVLASPGNRAVLDVNPYVNEVVTFDKWDRLGIPRFLRELRRRRYDVVIDAMVTQASVNATILMYATGAPYRVGIGGRENAFALTLPVPEEDQNAHHLVQEATVLRALGLDPAAVDLQPEIFLRDDAREVAERTWARFTPEGDPASDAADRRARLLINISTHHESRLWPEDRFAAVVRAVRAGGRIGPVLLIGLPRDRERLERIEHASGGHLIATATIGEALALVATADLVFTPDTGIAHASSAFRKTAVVLLGPFKEPFAPYGSYARLLKATTGDYVSVQPEHAVAALEAAYDEWRSGRS